MGFPKFLLDVGGRTAAGWILEKAREALGGPAVVVVRSAERDLWEHVRPAPPSPPLLVSDPRSQQGRTGSIQAGLEALERFDPLVGCILWPVDLPLVARETVVRLVRELLRLGPGARVVPTHRGRGGHPVALGRAVWPLVHRLDPESPLRALLSSPGTHRLEVGDRGILADLNTPEDVRRWLGFGARPMGA
jgi:molybdenum cofactor cytidylyltransferase